MTVADIPPDREQLEFLDKLQRLFEEGEFVATYKFALLISLTELAVEKGDDSGEPLDIPVNAIADKFLELYWHQVAPFSASGAAAGVLSQNRGKQASVVAMLQTLREAHGTVAKARSSRDWAATLRRAVPLLEKMPLWRLQTLRGQAVEFLYTAAPDAKAVRLLPGVSYNLRRFNALVQHLARSAWLNHIRSNRQNAPILGQATDLEAFLFGADRASLAAASNVLRDVQSDQCFYCQKELHAHGEVDHFVPWSRYPRDLAHNFVLAHQACNADKSDLLAAVPHLARWQERNERHDETLAEGLSGVFTCDRAVARQVAKWAYAQAYAARAQSWLARKQVVPLSAEFSAILN